MLRTELAADLRADELAPGFVRPAWSDYCFGNVPDTVRSLFDLPARRALPEDVFDGVDTDVDHVVCAFVDGLGWNHLQRATADHPLLARLTSRARVTPLTSTYPSETAAAVSTFNTGTQPCEHGVLGWNAHVDALGGSIQTLPFTDSEDTPLEACLDTADPDALIDREPIYGQFPDAVVIAPEGQGESTYSRQTTAGARSVGYMNPADGAYRTRAALEAASEPTYVYLYVPTVDASAHRDGVGHEATDAQLGMVSAALERELVERLDPAVAERTLLLVLADHGEVDATPRTTVDLGSLDLDVHLQRDSSGEPIPVQGGPRNLQFHARDGHRAELKEVVREGLAPLSPLVLDRESVLEEQLFGDREPSERFLRRCPDVLAIPRDGFAWYDDGHLEYVGMHGGLHPDEMLVPFAAARMDTLVG